ncbi:MAG: polysaccharide biosynthesis protein [Oscillospiraceae bacterium]|nr:polysaccharide biosynthesis protein [Oscillospiraceae bacterium]
MRNRRHLEEGERLRKQKEKHFGLVMQRLLLPVYDVVAVNLSYILAMWTFQNFDPLSDDDLRMVLLRILYVAPISLGFFFLFHLYHSLWKYAGSDELGQCAAAAAVAGAVCFFADWVLFGFHGLWGVHRQLNPAELLIAYLLTLMFCGGIRISYRAIRRSKHQLTMLRRSNRQGFTRVMVVGAGDMGNIVLSELRANDFRKGTPCVVVDDDRTKQGKSIYGVPIRGGCDRIPELAAKYQINEILLCIPSAGEERQRQLTEIALHANCAVKLTPSLLEMKESGTAASLGQLREVRLEDLLMRPQVQLDPKVCVYLLGQTILITGGGGSIGSELCRQAMHYGPGRIILFDMYENNAFSLKAALDREYKGTPQIEIRIGSVQDPEALESVFAEFEPTVVLHAAAHKHVPLMEDCPVEAVKNNVFGTLLTAETALRHGVRRFVLLSTDKAVNPTNVMGATKRVTELILQSLARRVAKQNGQTRFAAVRFGNVLGSSGSVIPLFREQIRAGGPVTVTDPDITRYFMSIPEAAQLVLQAGGLSAGGEIFVLDMGEPVRILHLAEQMIRLSGLRPYEDIAINITGLRPGEKLHEELALEEELAAREATANNKIYITFPTEPEEEALAAGLERLRHCTQASVRGDLRALVGNYHTPGGSNPAA